MGLSCRTLSLLLEFVFNTISGFHTTKVGFVNIRGCSCALVLISVP